MADILAPTAVERKNVDHGDDGIEAATGAMPPGLKLKIKSGKLPFQSDAADRVRVMDRWDRVYTEFISAGVAKKPRCVRTFLADTFEAKATSTLSSRASSWTLYLAWARRSNKPPLPLTEELVAEYLRFATGVAPTRAT